MIQEFGWEEKLVVANCSEVKGTSLRIFNENKEKCFLFLVNTGRS